MVRTRHRLALAGVVVLLVAGVVLHATHPAANPGGSGSRADGGRGAFVVEPPPVSAVAAVGRVRGGADAELLSLMRLSTWPLLAFVLVASPRLRARVRSWRLSRPDRRSGSPLLGSMLAAWRAPPAFV